MNVKRRGAVQVNRALRGEVTFGFAVRGTRKGGEREGGMEGGRVEGPGLSAGRSEKA